jgi:hypothetical protein
MERRWRKKGTYIPQHVVEARGLRAFAIGAICTGIFCFFFAEV